MIKKSRIFMGWTGQIKIRILSKMHKTIKQNQEKIGQDF